ncbi:MAG: flagellar hook-length control protein FliK [Halothiobacillaceae bacterium]|nr:flagellar hook-length control protein FliK [Halothiobacillaceae bacterium]
MKLLKVEQPGQSAQTASQTGPVLRLQTGQRLAAIALTDAKPGGKATLSVAGGQLQVTTQQPLKAGQTLDLEVTRLGQQVHLRAVGQPPDPRRADQAQLTRSLLQALARVSGEAPSNRASVVDRTPAAQAEPSGRNVATTSARGANQSAPQATISARPSTTASLTTPSPTTLSRVALPVPPGLDGLLPLLSALRDPPRIRELVGSWLATRQHPALAAASPAGIATAPAAVKAGLPESPLGAVLQQAARQLRATPDLAPPDPSSRQATLDFIQRLGDSVERSQLGTALSQGSAGQAAGTHSGPGQPIWLLEVPLQLAGRAHSLRLAIREEEERDSPGGAARWQVDLAMDWPELGPMHAALTLHAGRIDVDLFTDRATTVSLIEASRDTLAQGLSGAGLIPGRLGAYTGPPPAAVRARLEPDPPTGPADTPHGFLSEQA